MADDKEVFTIKSFGDNNVVLLTINSRTHACMMLEHESKDELTFLEASNKDLVCTVQNVLYKHTMYAIIIYNSKADIAPFLIDGRLVSFAVDLYKINQTQEYEVPHKRVDKICLGKGRVYVEQKTLKPTPKKKREHIRLTAVCGGCAIIPKEDHDEVYEQLLLGPNGKTSFVLSHSYASIFHDQQTLHFHLCYFDYAEDLTITFDAFEKASPEY